jgi:uncharacterized protein (TIGR02099 family)
MKQKLLPYVKKIGIAFAITYALFIIIFSLAFQFYIKPNLNNYKSKIEALASQATGQTIKINSLDGRWNFINPEIALNEVVFYDDQNNTTLALKKISADFSWLSPFYFSPTLSEIRLQTPKLLIKRDRNNKIFIGGILIDGPANNKLTNWLLNQKKVAVKQGEIDWHDEYRQAPILTLKDLNFSYKTPFIIELIGKHKFDLNFRISNSDNQFIDLNGNIYAKKIEDIHSWDSEVKIKAGNINLAAYTPWVNYPIKINAGTGDLNLTATITNAAITKIKASIKLTSFKTELNQAYKNELNLKNFSGDIIWLSNNKGHQIAFENLYLLTNNGINIQDANSSITISTDTNKPTAFSLQVNKIQLEAANEILQTIPYFDDIKNKVNRIQPSGTLSNLSLHWFESDKAKINLETQFDKLSLKSFEDFPGLENLTGSIHLSDHEGSLKFKSTDVSLTYNKLFREQLRFNDLHGDLKWTENYLILKNISFNNPYINGSINGSIKFYAQKAADLDIHASIPLIDLKHAKTYYPKTIRAENLHWLDTSLLEGNLENILVTIKGSSADFPFVDSNNQPDSSKGSFLVTATGKNTLIEYGLGWPVVEKFDFNASINAGTFELTSKRGQFLGNTIKDLKTTIPAMSIEHPILNIQGTLNSPTREAIKFINSSPIKESVQHLFDEASGSGEGKLIVNIDIPMDNLNAITFKGQYQFLDSNLSNASIGIPHIEKIKGIVTFDEKNVKANNLNGTMFGGNTIISLTADPSKVIKVKLNGRFTDKGIEEKLGTSFSKLNGSAEWEGLVEYKKPLLNIQISSDLKGIEMGYPAPFNKARDKEEKFYFSKKQNNPKNDDIEFKFSNIVNSKISRSEKNNAMVIDKGYVSINSDIKSAPQKGLYLKADLPYANIDDFVAIYSGSENDQSFKIDKADIALKNADLFDRRFNNIKIEIAPVNKSTKLKISSNETSGNLLWSEKDNKLIARLSHLSLPNEIKKISSAQTTTNQKIPNLDIKIGTFEVDSKKIGKLELISNTSKQNIDIQKFKITNDTNVFQADGEWLDWNKNSKSNLNFNWKINNLGNTLDFMGYNHFIKDGDAEISGQFKWVGSPINFDKTKINGSFTLDIHKGTILKVEPGVGRLFGLVTLQSLPRRLSLDFRDLFGSGFIFDSINATVKIDSGVMKTTNFRMNGPSAEAFISGETNIIKETQDLNVKVTPHISDSLSIAALVGGPLAGAAAFVAQKILKDPLNKILSSEYRIIGTWENPEEVNNSASDKIKTTIDNTKNLFNDKK